jgi:hypothetical protein
MTTREECAASLRRARYTVVERAIVAFIERLEGRVVSHTEILRHGYFVEFVPDALLTEVRGLHRFYMWKRKHALAWGYPDAGDPLTIHTEDITAADWPTMLRIYNFAPETVPTAAW